MVRLRAFPERSRKPRFAYTGLAGEEHYLAFAGLCFGPAPQQQFKFFFPPDESSQSSRVQRLEAILNRTRPQRGPGTYWLGDTLDFLGPKVLELEQIADKFSRAGTYDDGVWLGYALQARCEVRRLADDRLLLSRTRPDQVADHNEPGRDAHTGLHWNRGLQPPTAWINSSPARTARSGSSSCACG